MKSGSGKNVATRTISHPQPCSPVSRPMNSSRSLANLQERNSPTQQSTLSVMTATVGTKSNRLLFFVVWGCGDFPLPPRDSSLFLSSNKRHHNIPSLGGGIRYTTLSRVSATSSFPSSKHSTSPLAFEDLSSFDPTSYSSLSCWAIRCPCHR